MMALACQFFAAEVHQGNFGAAAETPEAAAAPQKGKRNSYPFSGELESRDARSITLKGKKKPRVLLLTSETRIMRNGVKARWEDAKPGERVSGSTRKNAEGREGDQSQPRSK
jgi:hypothetical protein